MRKVIFAALAWICSCAAGFAQSKTPSAVDSAFNQKFQGATKVKWYRESEEEFEATFVRNGIKYSANFRNTGEWLETEYLTTFAKLPLRVQRAYLLSHTGSKIKAVAQIETSQGKIKFEIELKQGGKILEVFYDEYGNEIEM